jgi:hypothetical protein
MDALHEWHEFYFMLGGAAAALVALLFVAISIGVGFYTDRNVAATRTFVSPVVIHFTAVLVVAALALTPGDAAPLPVIALAGVGIAGCCVGAATTRHVFDYKTTGEITFFDHFAYGVIPAIAYLGMAGAAILFAEGWKQTPNLLAAAILLLLLINIRNAWDLMLSVVRRQGRRETEKRRKAD